MYWTHKSMFYMLLVHTFMVGLNKAETLFLSFVGSGSDEVLVSSDSVRCMARRQQNCSEATFLVTQNVYTWQPAATYSLLSLWPHVSAEMGFVWKENIISGLINHIWNLKWCLYL